MTKKIPARLSPMTGKHARWRPKVRQPRSYVMTKQAHVLLDYHLERTGLSRGDFLESLVRQFGDRIEPEPGMVDGDLAAAVTAVVDGDPIAPVGVSE